MTISRLQSVRFSFYNKIETNKVKYFSIPYDSFIVRTTVYPGGLDNSIERLKEKKNETCERNTSYYQIVCNTQEARESIEKEFNSFFFF